jgi:predicted RNA-binding protein YlqC (UPF0109 family)
VSRELLSYVAPWLVDHPEEVSVTEVETEGDAVVLEVTLHPDDVGKIIGKKGRTIRSLRALAKAAGQREGRSVSVEVVD